jgi:uncharacterized protein YfaT (DUF1175 family)
LNEVEQECIILNSLWGMIDGMVNWTIFAKRDLTAPTTMMFETCGHAKLFNILLADFLSEIRAFKGQPFPLGLKAAPTGARPTDLSYLFYLRQVCANPLLGSNAEGLKKTCEGFASWLEGEILAENVNFPDIDIVANLRIPRYRYLKICGDISKHNLARLAGNVKHIRSFLEVSGNPITEQDGYLAVENFYDWFHRNIFLYHTSTIVEHLNEIRLATFEYLQPEYDRSWHVRESTIQGVQAYGFQYPSECLQPLARAMYWELMNRVRAQPCMNRIVIDEIMKRRY